MRKYHLVTVDGERTITADTVNQTPTGALVFNNATGELVCCYAAGQWLMVEVEARDDREGEEPEPEQGKAKRSKK